MSDPRPRANFADLWVRVISAAVLVTIALVDFWQGGIYVTLLVMLGTGLMLWEYRRILTGAVRKSDLTFWVMGGAGVLCVLGTGVRSLPVGLAILAAGVIALALVERERRLWMIAGLVYIAAAMAFLVELRRDPVQGFPLVLWLVSVVIAADVGGYFAGRLIGGPKLWVRVSPNKTWAGMLGGLVLAVAVGAAFYGSGHVSLPWIVLLSAVLALASQAGDLLESALKRRFGVKDSSSLIPGHGGLLDRFDGLLGALWLFGIMGLAGALGA